MIQIARNNITSSDSNQLAHLREEFSEKHCVLIRQFLEPALLEYILRQISKSRFVTKLEMNDDDEFGKVLFIPTDEPSLFVFNMIMNNQKLFRTVEEITGCQPIGNFFGRIHSSEPDSNHHIAWHGDNTDTRLLGVTVNLGTETFSGGLFQLREKDTEKIVCEIGQTHAGDAFIFRIDPNLQHRLTVVESGGRRTVGVGWFRSKPDWETFSKNFFYL